MTTESIGNFAYNKVPVALFGAANSASFLELQATSVKQMLKAKNTRILSSFFIGAFFVKYIEIKAIRKQFEKERLKKILLKLIRLTKNNWAEILNNKIFYLYSS